MGLTNEQRLAKAETVPAWLQYAFIKVKDSIQYNSAFGFISGEEVKSEKFQELKADFAANQGKLVNVTKVANGLVIDFPLSIMYRIIKTVVPEMPAEAVTKYMQKREASITEDTEACKTLLNGIKKKGSTEIDFGLYCVNKVNGIKHGEVLYKAYKLTIRKFFTIASELGMQNQLYIKDITTNKVIAITNPAAMQAFTIADSKNGVVCKLIYRAN